MTLVFGITTSMSDENVSTVNAKYVVHSLLFCFVNMVLDAYIVTIRKSNENHWQFFNIVIIFSSRKETI